MKKILFLLLFTLISLVSFPMSRSAQIHAQSSPTLPIMYRISYRGDNNLDKIGRLKPKYVNNHPFGGYKLSRAEIAEIKRVSPNTKVILYRSGVELFNPTGITQYGPIEWATTGEQAFAESQTSTADWQDIWQNHKNWLAKDKNGKYIHRQDGWAFAQPGVAYLANIGNPGYQQWLADWVKEKITVDGFDGVYFDLMYPGYFNGGWRCFDYKPCFPVYNGISTSQQLESQWRTWEIRLVTHIRSKLKKDPATENGIIFLNAILGITDFKDQNGIQYLKDTNPDGITFDGWRIMETDQWEDGVKLLNNISKNGLYSVPLANIHDKVWSQDEAQRVYQFYLSSFLLAYHNNSALRIRLKIKQNAGDTKGKPKYYLTEIADFFTTNNLGQPQAEYAKSSNGVYSRAFTNSLVVVNPSNQNKTFIVDQKYINAFFHDLSYVAGASITLPPQSGTVLIKPNAIPSPNPADLVDTGDTSDDQVNQYDANQLKADFGKTGVAGWIKADINDDGQVNIFDYNILVGAFGE